VGLPAGRFAYHPASVGARRLFALLAVVAVFGGCTGDAQPPTGPSSADAPPTVDTGDVAFEPGEFEYSWRGVDIRFSMGGSMGTLEIDNGSGDRLGAPGLYAFLGDGTRSDATISAPGPIQKGEKASFDVTFSDGVDETTVGLIILLIGDRNWGALEPVQVEE